MQTNGFFPSSTRNRIAMAMGLLSLILLMIWNFTPYHIDFPAHSEQTTMAKSFWPLLPVILRSIDASNLNFEVMMVAMAILLLCLQALLSFAIIPAWKLWQASAVLRLIPASLMFLGFIVILILNTIQPPQDHSMLYVLHIMAANFLTAAISLLLFKNESIE